MANETKTARYPWHLAPEWATHAATEKNGGGYWYGLHFTADGWRHKWQQIGGIFYGTDYGNSLELRPTEPQAEPLTIGEAMQRNAEAAARLLDAPSYREHLRAQFAGQIYAAYVQKMRDPNTLDVVEWAVEESNALIAALYPSPKTDTEK